MVETLTQLARPDVPINAASPLGLAPTPMSEMLTYGNELTAMTQGRGSFNMEMDHYDFVPAQAAEKIITAAKAAKGATTDEEEE